MDVYLGAHTYTCALRLGAEPRILVGGTDQPKPCTNINFNLNGCPRQTTAMESLKPQPSLAIVRFREGIVEIASRATCIVSLQSVISYINSAMTILLVYEARLEIIGSSRAPSLNVILKPLSVAGD